MMVEMPLWVAIIFLTCFILMMFHTIFGDLLGKMLYRHFKEKIKEKENKMEDD